ncbi:helix-turn-helix domain-containing protein [Roseovarius sp. C7]|uniref:helix-turn-helix domain-containing protein n=1 Tax=Roseovarius sp. C7 TaxID=3398643 RepID=UPI0039F66DDB
MNGNDRLGPLLTIEEAAKMLNVPKQSLRSAAQSHGMLVRMGRAVRIDPNQLRELIELCRGNRKDRDSTGGTQRESGASAIRAVPTVQQARQTAAKLKGL